MYLNTQCKYLYSNWVDAVAMVKKNNEEIKKMGKHAKSYRVKESREEKINDTMTGGGSAPNSMFKDWKNLVNTSEYR